MPRNPGVLADVKRAQTCLTRRSACRNVSGRRDSSADWRSGDEFAAQHSDRLTAELYTIAVEPDPQRATARRELTSRHLRLAEALAPIRRQTTVRRAGDGIFVDARSWREEPRDEVDAIGRRAAGDHDAANRQRAKGRVIRHEPMDGVFAPKLDQIIKT